MPAYTVAFDVARQAFSSVQHMTRDFGVSARDDFTLRLRAYGQDGDAAPLNLAGATGSVSLWVPGENVATLTLDGTVASPSTAGNMDFYFAPASTTDLLGRYLWTARINVDGESVVVRGSINIRQTPDAIPLSSSGITNLILLEDGGGIVLEGGEGFVVLET